MVFFSVYFGSGAVSAVVFSFWQGFAFSGLGLPFGQILGLIIYLALIAMFSKPEDTHIVFSSSRSLSFWVAGAFCGTTSLK